MKLKKAVLWAVGLFLWMPDAYAAGPWCSPFRVVFGAPINSPIHTWMLSLKQDTIAKVDPLAVFELSANDQRSTQKIITDLQHGNIALAVLSAEQLRKQFSKFAILDFPGLLPDAKSIVALYKGGKYLSEVEYQVRNRDLSVLAIGDVPYTLLLRKNYTFDAESLRGKKIHTFSEGHRATVRALGGSPVMLPPTKIQQSLKRGVVDGAFWPTIASVPKMKNSVYSAIVSPPYSGKAVLVGSRRFLERANEDVVKKFMAVAKESSLKYTEERKIAIPDQITKFQRYGVSTKYYTTNEIANVAHIDFQKLWLKWASNRGEEATSAFQAIERDLGLAR